MRIYSFVIIIFCLMIGCSSQRVGDKNQVKNEAGSIDDQVVIAFGSCNKTEKENVFWDDILAANPDVFIWGGDNIYADTDDISKMEAMYSKQKNLPAYANLAEKIFITGTWDDHDYGLNDGGSEFSKKVESQQLFLDFMNVPKEDIRRTREGVYSSQIISKPQGLVKIINLDTRYYRTPLTDGRSKGVRYRSNTYGDGTILGEAQWQWLTNELANSKADFNLIVSSIQFLSGEHGFEKWANHPHEVDRMLQLIDTSGAKRVIFLSGDRHISEFSKMQVDSLDYPLIDFTSSGLTHSYTSFKGEPNRFRVGKVVSTPSFGLFHINLKSKEVVFKIMGQNEEVYHEIKQGY